MADLWASAVGGIFISYCGLVSGTSLDRSLLFSVLSHNAKIFITVISVQFFVVGPLSSSGTRVDVKASLWQRQCLTGFMQA